MRQGAAGVVSNGLEARQQIEIGRKGLALEAGHADPEIPLCKGPCIHNAASQETSTHRAEGHKSHAELATGVEHGDLRISGPR